MKSKVNGVTYCKVIGLSALLLCSYAGAGALGASNTLQLLEPSNSHAQPSLTVNGSGSKTSTTLRITFYHGINCQTPFPQYVYANGSTTYTAGSTYNINTTALYNICSKAATDESACNLNTVSGFAFNGDNEQAFTFFTPCYFVTSCATSPCDVATGNRSVTLAS